MTKSFLFIFLLFVFASPALVPVYATSHEAIKAETTTEVTAPDATKANDATAAATDGEKKEKKEGQEDEEPDCD